MTERNRRWQPGVWALLTDAFTSNLGFFLLVPLIAVQLTQHLGWAAWAAGLVLAIRQFAQQGLAPWGGSLADRLGYRAAVTLGMEVRALGFVLFAFAHTPLLILTAALLSGLGGALFGPADAAALAVSVDPSDRQRVFALRTVCGNAGMVLGPLVGAYLLTASFSLVAWAAGLVFAVSGIFTWYFYPPSARQPESPQPFVTGFRQVLENRPFVHLTMILSGYYLLSSQLYILIPLAVLAEHGPAALIGWLFSVYSTLAILLQTSVTRLTERLGTKLQLTFGLAATALGMLIAGITHTPYALFGTMVLFALGSMLVMPASFQLTSDLADPHIFGLFYGFSRLSQGIGGSLGNAVGGLLFSIAQGMGFLGLPWLVLAVAGGLSTLAMQRVDLRTVHARSGEVAASS